MVNKRVKNAVLGCSFKNGRMISVCFQSKPFTTTVIQAYPPTSNTEEAEVERFYENLQDLLEWTPKKDVLFIIGDWNAKVGSQETSGVTGNFCLGIWSEAGQGLIEFCQENALVIANTIFQQHKRRHWTSPDGQHWNQVDYILCSQRWRSSIQSAKTRLGADCGSDHELLIAKFRLELKKVGETTRPFSSVQFSSVAQSCPTLCDPMNRSTPGLPVHHQFPEFTQTRVHRVSDAIQPSHPLSSPSSNPLWLYSGSEK